MARLYEEIRDRFIELYRFIHRSDEAGFSATIEPSGAGLAMAVDFYGRGTHPPQALHSEGHQDSMGLCLYLVLAERLNAGVLDLIVLDDVVMSVDAEHRREVCRLLKTFFPNHQFVITTHDRTWATQLDTEGLIPRKNMYEFHNWNVDTGPLLSTDAGTWDKIYADLDKADVLAAAVRLRRSLEQFFSSTCEALGAPVRYRENGRWDLGDLISPAVGQYRTLLKKAKAAAQSWGDANARQSLQDYEETFSKTFEKANVEQWAVNASVHYNNWADLSVADFRPVVGAFEELCTLFRCNSCYGLLRVTRAANHEENVRCNCGQTNWNLVEKDKKQLQA